MILLHPNLCRTLILPAKVYHLRHELFLDRNVEPQRKLVRIILVVWEAEAVIEQEELVGSIAVAVENLLTGLYHLSILVDQREVGVIRVLLRLKPIKFLISLIAV